MLATRYLNAIHDLLNSIEREQVANIEKAGRMIADC